MSAPTESILSAINRFDISEDFRAERRNALNSLKNRVSAWIVTFDRRDSGPSIQEMKAVIEDLEGRMDDLREYAKDPENET